MQGVEVIGVCPRCSSSRTEVLAVSTYGIKSIYKAACQDCGLLFSKKHGTVIIRGDRVTFAALTADPASCVAGDQWIRIDTRQIKFAVDAVMANVRIASVEGHTHPAAHSANCQAADVPTGSTIEFLRFTIPAGRTLTIKAASIHPAGVVNHLVEVFNLTDLISVYSTNSSWIEGNLASLAGVREVVFRVHNTSGLAQAGSTGFIAFTVS